MTDTPEFLTVPELADLLRIKERKVYDLVSTGDVPCTRATGKLLFSKAEIRSWIDNKRSGNRAVRPAVFLGSHDPLLEWALRQSRCAFATFLDGSSDGVTRFLAGEGVATGLHIPNEKSEGWNVGYVSKICRDANAVLVSWAKRQRGLIVQTASEIADIEDVAHASVAIRQPGSGASISWDRLMVSSSLDLSAIQTLGPYHSEQDAVLAVLEGDADVTFGLRAVAARFDLRFIPMIEESFDILVDRTAYFEPGFQSFLRFCRSNAFLDRAKATPGYDVSQLGEVRWNG